MVKISVFEEFETVPVVSLHDIDRRMQQSEDNLLSFPIPGKEFSFIRLNLSQSLIPNPAHTFFVQLTDHSLSTAGFTRGDIVVVDRQANPRHHDIVIAYLEGEFTIRWLDVSNGYLSLKSDEESLKVEPDMTFKIWGVVKDVIYL